MVPTITLGTQSYELTFNHNQVRKLCEIWGLGDSLTKYNIELQKRLKGVEKEVTFKHLDTFVDIIYAAILAKNAKAVIDKDELYDCLWKDQEELMSLIQTFISEQGQNKKKDNQIP